VRRRKHDVVPSGFRRDPRQDNASDAEKRGADDQRFGSEHQTGPWFPHVAQFRVTAAVEGCDASRADIAATG
jgi:hypothetical protein